MNVKKCRNDYADRKGLTQKPVLQDEGLLSVSPLHSVMRTFDFVKHLLYHLRAGIFEWSDAASKIGDRKPDLDKAKEDVKAHVKEETGITMDTSDYRERWKHR